MESEISVSEMIKVSRSVTLFELDKIPIHNLQSQVKPFQSKFSENISNSENI